MEKLIIAGSLLLALFIAIHILNLFVENLDKKPIFILSFLGLLGIFFIITGWIESKFINKHNIGILHSIPEIIEQCEQELPRNLECKLEVITVIVEKEL